MDDMNEKISELRKRRFPSRYKKEMRRKLKKTRVPSPAPKGHKIVEPKRGDVK